MRYGPSPRLTLALPNEAAKALDRLSRAFGISRYDVLRTLAVALAERPHFVQAYLLTGASFTSHKEMRK